MSSLVKRLSSFATFAAGCSAGLLLLQAGAELDAQGSGAIHVCAANDGVLRLTQNSECPADQRSLYLAGPSPQNADEKTRNDDPVIKRIIAELEKRVARLEELAERGELGNRAEAPFEVKDRSGNRIFRVEPGFVRFYNTQGKTVAQMAISDNGSGRLVALSATEDKQASAGASGQSSGVSLTEAGQERLKLGTTGNKYSLKIQSDSGNFVAGIGQNVKGGAGLVLVDDSGGIKKAALEIAEDGKGRVVILNKAGNPVAYFTEGAYGGGNLTLNSATNQTMVEAGVTQAGVGVVRVGPASFKPGSGLFGLPSSYIIGKK
jgi:hypothetical protein